MNAKYDLVIEDNPTPPEDARLISMRFPAMRSQLDNPADLIELKVKPASLKFQMKVEDNLYSSTTDKVDDGQLFVCQVVHNKLVCRPLSHLVTMRADFSHLDQKDEVPEVNEEATPIVVKLAHADRQSKYPSRASAAETEDLITDYEDIRFRSANSREAAAQRVAHFGPKHIKMEVDAEPDDVKDVKPDIKPIPNIIPKAEKIDIDDIYSSGGQTSKKPNNAIRQMIKECLIKAKLVNFEEVYRYIEDKIDSNRSMQFNTKDLIDGLTEYAVLVQGNWAVKSDVLYGDSVERLYTDVTGISIGIFVAARDYLLWLFNQNRLISRLEYSRQVRMPDHDILVLFNQLAVFRQDSKRWELKLPTDERFITRFPEVVQRQANFWKVRRANKLSMFK